MIITSVERQKRKANRYNIYIDEEYAFSVHEDVLIRHGLFKGLQLENDELQELIQREEENKAYHSALHYLKFRSRSKKEMETYLIRQKGIDVVFVAKVLQRLQKEGYLNDEQFAKDWSHFRIQQSKGRKYVKAELREKGLTEQQIQSALSGINPDQERESAFKLAKARWNRYAQEDWPAIQRKLGGYLLRQGFTNEVVYSVLQEAQNWREKEE
jgi:regulatory protein